MLSVFLTSVFFAPRLDYSSDRSPLGCQLRVERSVGSCLLLPASFRCLPPPVSFFVLAHLLIDLV